MVVLACSPQPHSEQNRRCALVWQQRARGLPLAAAQISECDSAGKTGWIRRSMELPVAEARWYLFVAWVLLSLPLNDGFTDAMPGSGARRRRGMGTAGRPADRHAMYEASHFGALHGIGLCDGARGCLSACQLGGVVAAAMAPSWGGRRLGVSFGLVGLRQEKPEQHRVGGGSMQS